MASSLWNLVISIAVLRRSRSASAPEACSSEGSRYVYRHSTNRVAPCTFEGWMDIVTREFSGIGPADPWIEISATATFPSMGSKGAKGNSLDHAGLWAGSVASARWADLLIVTVDRGVCLRRVNTFNIRSRITGSMPSLLEKTSRLSSETTREKSLVLKARKDESADWVSRAISTSSFRSKPSRRNHVGVKRRGFRWPSTSK